MKREQKKNKWTRRFLILALVAFLAGAGCMAAGCVVGISRGEVETFIEQYVPDIEPRIDAIFRD